MIISFGLAVTVQAKEWSTPEAMRAFGKPGDTVNPALLEQHRKYGQNGHAAQKEKKGSKRNVKAKLKHNNDDENIVSSQKYTNSNLVDTNISDTKSISVNNIPNIKYKQDINDMLKSIVGKDIAVDTKYGVELIHVMSISGNDIIVDSPNGLDVLHVMSINGPDIIVDTPNGLGLLHVMKYN